MLVVNKRRAVLVLSALLATFLILRLSLYLSPGTNLDIGPYNIHHLFTGLLLITFGGLPLIIINGKHWLLDIAALAFGAGLSMALDEWVYLIVTDGSDMSYLLPVSWWGAVVMIGIAAVYILLLITLLRCHDNDQS